MMASLFFLFLLQHFKVCLNVDSSGCRKLLGHFIVSHGNKKSQNLVSTPWQQSFEAAPSPWAAVLD
jgi:hypothetical protein